MNKTDSPQFDSMHVNRGYYSVRHPKNVWMVRLFGLILALSFVNVDFSEISSQIPNRHAKWAALWVAQNNLDIPVPTPSNFKQELFAANEELELEQTKSQHIVSNSSIYSSSSNKVKATMAERVKVSALAMSSLNPSLVQKEMFIAPPVADVDYQRNLQISYERMAALPDNKSAYKSRQWVAGGAIGPQFASAKVIEPDANMYVNQSNISAISATQQGVGTSTMNNGYSAMINLGVDVGNNFELISGLNYSKLGGAHSSYFNAEVEKHQTILTSVATTNNEGVTTYTREEQDIAYTNYFSDTLSANYQLSSIEIPLVLKYNFGKNKLNYFVSSGLSTTIGSSYSATYSAVEIGTGNINGVKYGMNAVNFLIGMGVQYNATKHFKFQVSPGYRYGIPVSSNSYLRSATSSLGLFTGLNYYF